MKRLRLYSMYSSSFLLLALSLMPIGQARDWFVATTGNDANEGSQVAPFRTVQTAVSNPLLAPGDTIYLRGGFYDENYDGVRISRSGREDAWITLKSYPNEKAHIHSTWSAQPGQDFPTLWLESSNSECWRQTAETCPPMFWRVEDLELSGGFYVIKIDAGKIKLINNNIHGASADLIKMVQQANDVVVFGNRIHDPKMTPPYTWSGTPVNPGPYSWDNPPLSAYNDVLMNAQGIDMVGGDRMWVAYNHVYNIPTLGMYAKGNARNAIFENNRVENVFNQGIMLGQYTTAYLLQDGLYESYDGIIRNNIIRNTHGACVAVSSSSNAKVYNNSCYNVAIDWNGGIYVSNDSSNELQPNTNVEIKNNIVVMGGPGRNGQRPAVSITRNALTDDRTLFIDNNIFWHVSGQSAADALTFTWARTDGEVQQGKRWIYRDTLFADWRRLTAEYGYPQDANSRVADPMYTDAATFNFLPRGDSPAIDNAATPPCQATDFLSQSNPDTRPVQQRRPVDGNGDGTAQCDVGAYEVQSGVPTARIVATPTSGAAPLTVSFDGSSSSDTDGSITSYAWNFGDGTTGSGAQISHPYSTSGTYRATLTVTDNSGLTSSTQTTITVSSTTTPPPTGQCTTADAATEQWKNVSFDTQTGKFTAQWDVTPNTANGDLLIALSSGPQTTWTGLAAIVRFNTGGTIDARNGSAYAAATNLSYTAGTSYRVKMIVDVPTRTYSAWVTPAGEAETQIASNYAFRTEQQSVSSLNNYVLEAEIGSGSACNFSLNPVSDAQAPTIAMTAPTNGSSVSGSIALSADANDNVGVVGVQFLVNGAPVGAEDTAQPYSTSYDTRLLANGSHRFSARARDAAGNTATAAEVTVNVQNESIVTRLESDDPGLSYTPIGTGHWSLDGSSPYASGGTYSVGNGAGAVVEFSFTGSGIKWIAILDQYSGQARVTLDGASEIVDLYRPSGASDFGWQKTAWQKAGLASGNHTVKIEVLGTKNPSSGGIEVSVDAFDISQ